MLKHLVFIFLVMASASGHAEVFMCKKASGETEFSDTPCKAGSSSELVPDRDPLTQQQKDNAQQRLQQQSKEASERAVQRSAAQVDQQRREKEAAEQAAPAPADAIDEGAVYGCNDGRRRDSNCGRRLNDRGPYKRPVPR